MITVSANARILVARNPVDFRKGLDGLAAVVQETLKMDPFCGTIFIFRAKRADRLKVLIWDGTGLCLFHKRLEKGRFLWPALENGAIVLTAAQLSVLLEGLDWTRIVPKQPRRPQRAC